MVTLQSASLNSSLKRKRIEGKSERKKKDAKSEKKRKQGKNAEKKKDAELPISHRLLKDDDHSDEEEFYNESPRSYGGGSMLQDLDGNAFGLPEGSDTEDDAFSHSDEEDIRVNDQPTSDDSVHLSSFNLHLEHTLSKEVIDNQKNSKFTWEIPAIGMSNCKWRGTGENIFKDLTVDSFNGLKAKLYEHWMDVYKASGGKDINSPKQKMFFSLCSSYRDILYHNKRPFYLKGVEDTSIMDAYIMHSN